MSIDQQRLARVLELLASPSDGEVLNAARIATRILRDADVTWTQLTERAFGAVRPASAASRPTASASRPRSYGRKAAPEQARTTHHKGVSAVELVAHLRTMPARMTPWEQAFLASLASQRSGLTQRQWWVLWDIAKKAGAIVEDVA